jgi:hypothetical protein
MDIDFDPVVTTIASSTTDNLVTFSPVFLLIGGILLAFITMAVLVSIVTGRPVQSPFDDDMDDQNRV